MRYHKQKQHPNWLRRVQEQSWEPELLISGLILFALFQVPGLIDQLAFTLELNSSRFLARSSVDEMIGTLLKISVYILIVGFITHILLRSIWVAYAGLSYLYKDGIKLSSLSMPEYYIKHLNRHSYENRVKKLEKICSGMFSLSFLFFMVILGLINIAVIISLLVFLTITFIPEFDHFIIFTVIFMFTGIFYLFDLITLGLIRRVPFLRKAYYPFYKVGRLAMLGPLYEDIYYGFISNNKKWKAGVVTSLFFLVFLISSIELRNPGTFTTSYALQIDNSDMELAFEGHYEDRAAPDEFGFAMIPSDIIRDNVLRVFVLHVIGHETDAFLQKCDDRFRNNNLEEPEFELKCLNDLYRVAVNDSVYTAKGLFQHNATKGVNGLVYWLDISHLPRGMHTAKMYRKIVRPDTSFYAQRAHIEFFKDVSMVK